ncbi:lipopolysaccharide biosynthesis protein RfbH [Turicibacter sanguinis]|uniref:lipopolysaccharide biosynthesis protein RfbH n=1 Tax=Turicibacter sanguinis TaxID=154288 RepID=UPI0012BB645F|nr:lipopolysaccharide biosynthesis protein RfbH [Turicibacter sanguinis]MDB8566200.1 lipopolysaccharide biosynthesis protein RfbH [Turicibacter sanguinis]MDB8568936.1 lipopolysaccharide biosynthesis protein RfbH [Turicibacter sanguinis]MDB8571701.1 lipopolysaccharide biosynthesis protein RfbH [Turicibacter sanguinis]MDB8580445.1 lipopolysaccharide biosynthesis protein RfbH [Turicibacter sanguinis]MTO10143.1 lipopolysaccharide biosynthesis protein RfbH [Turicibacter sanguinis]
MGRLEELKEAIFINVKEYYQEKYQNSQLFIEGETYINYGGRYFDEKELLNLVESSLDFWLTTGRFARKFEQNFANYLGVRYCSLCNSGSSANLLAFMSLTSPLLGERKINRGDEVITVACGFPTTVAPIIQYGAIPVFIDVEIPSYNINISQMREALSSHTKAVMVAHTLGNPFNLNEVKAFCDEHNLWLIEDNCDALGSEYYLNGKWRKTGTIGDIGTSSFYPPHHMTMGEGGAVYTNNPKLHKIINSFRDWGRDCWCDSGRDNTCQYRFTKQFGELPVGYDHKYVYSHFGYNLKLTDMQAAIGCAQLEKLDEIISIRRKNWDYLRQGLSGLEAYMILPEAEKDSHPSWFGFLMTLKEDSLKTRLEFAKYLENNKIQTRNLFAGNLLKHPAFDELKKTGEGFRVAADLSQTDFIMNNTLWIGVYPGMTVEMLDYMILKIKDFFE